jgi:exopolysaccharide production protein ExoQ
MRLLRKFENVYVVFTMLFLANGIIPRSVGENDQAGQQQAVPGDRILLGLVYLILAGLVFVHWKEILRGLRQSGWIVALCGLAVASSAWSFDMQFTARRSILLSAMTLFAIYIASCFDWEEIVNLFGWMSVVVVVGCAFMAIFVPYYGISHDIHSGAVKGLFPHKNIMGRQMAFALLTLWLGKPKALPEWFRYCMMAGACVLLLSSRAATSAVLVVICIGMYPLLLLMRLPRRRTLPLWVPLAPVFAMGVAIAIRYSSVALEIVGRSATLSGRTTIWDMVLQAVSRRPWFGYGYDVFWNRYTPDLAVVLSVLQFRPPHAHDGYLDLLLGLGRVGLLVFLAGFLVSLWRAGSLFVANEVRGAAWPLLVLLFFAAFNFTESNILRPFTFLWIPYVTIYVSLALMRAEARHAVLAEPPRVALVGGVIDSETGGSVSGALPGYGT